MTLTMRSPIDADWLATLLPNAGIEAVTAVPLEHGRGTTAKIYEVTAQTATGSKQFVVKLPRADQWERSIREIRLLETTDLPLHTARLLSAETDPATRSSTLVLTRICGENGDAVAGTTPGRLQSLVHDLALLHSSFRSAEALEKLEWLPRWGEGTGLEGRPHKRRVERFRRRVEPFLAEHGSAAPEWARGLLMEVGKRLERTFEAVYAIPPTLIHADAHLDNIVFKKDTAYWLDWQSASRGPGLYDLVRVLGETIDITADGALARRLVHAYSSHLRWHGVPEQEITAEVAHLPNMAAVVLAGFVSGFGGRTQSELGHRERAMMQRAVSANGLFGFVRHLI